MKLLGRIIGKICGRKYQSRMFDEVFISDDKQVCRVKYWRGLPYGYVEIPFTCEDIIFLYNLLIKEDQA